MCITGAGLHVRTYVGVANGLRPSTIYLHLTEIPQHQSLDPFLLSPSRSRSHSMEEGTTALTRMFSAPQPLAAT